MKQLLTTCALFFTALLTLFPLPASAGPRLTLYETSFDFGFVPQNALVFHAFSLISTGDDPLKIVKIVPGCSCTQAPIQKTTVTTGDSTRLEILFHTKTFLGLTEKHPKVITNELSPEKDFQILATVVHTGDTTHPIVINPWIVEIKGSPDSDQVVGAFDLINLTNTQYQIKEIAHDETYFTSTIPTILRAGSKARVVVAVAPKYLHRSFSRSMTIELDDEETTRFTIPIKYTWTENDSDEQ